MPAKLSTMTAYDIIGDVHGCADKLLGLLGQMGYREHAGAFRCPGRQAIFVGDLIDRGRYQSQTVNIVRAMVEAGTARAIMGNHEFNAISYVTSNPLVPGDFMRTHTGRQGEKNYDQHQRFLESVGPGSTLHREYIAWFRTLPLWLDLDGLRVVHACWHTASIAVLDPLFRGPSPVSEQFIIDANTTGTPAHQAVEVVTKGPDVDLGAGFIYLDKGGHPRKSARIRWWLTDATSLRELAEVPPRSTAPSGGMFPELPDRPCPDAARFRYQDDVPVFFGHYWRTGIPKPVSEHAACVDYSAVHNGRLVAYRWDGEQRPTAAQYCGFPDFQPVRASL